MLIDLIELLK